MIYVLDTNVLSAHALALDATLVTANIGRTIRIPGRRVEDWNR